MLTVWWKESQDTKSPTVIFIPKISAVNLDTLELSVGASIISIENSESGWLLIP